MHQPIRIVLLGVATVFLATAQVDPPGRVARLNYGNGQVSFRPGDVDDWLPAEVNRPLTSGDHLWTDEGARAELHIGTAALRLNSRTAFQFLNLDDNTVQIRLTEGSLNVHLRSLGERETFEVDTPNTSVALLRAGEYRIDVNPDNFVTAVTVRGGEGEVAAMGHNTCGESRRFRARGRRNPFPDLTCPPRRSKLGWSPLRQLSPGT